MAALKVNINGEPWEVHLVPPSRIRGVAGLCVYRTNRIYISTAQSPPDRLKTLIHELLHARFPDLDESVADECEPVFAQAIDWILQE